MNISDSNHHLIRGVQQRYGVHGEVAREIFIVSDGSSGLGSYTNYYRYDLWGNQIYSRETINPSTGWYHERFTAYYNDGNSPGFYAFQETFSQNQGTATDNPWSTQGGSWSVSPGVAVKETDFNTGWSEEVSSVSGYGPQAVLVWETPRDCHCCWWNRMPTPSMSLLGSIRATTKLR